MRLRYLVYVLLLSSPASAAPITYDFSGDAFVRLKSIDPAATIDAQAELDYWFPDIDLGSQPFTGSVTYDDNAPLNTRAQIRIGSHIFDGGPLAEPETPIAGHLYLTGYNPFVATPLPIGGTIERTDFTLDLPLNGALPGVVTFQGLLFDGARPVEAMGFLGTITRVPEPATLLLVTIGTALCVRRRRHLSGSNPV